MRSALFAVWYVLATVLVSILSFFLPYRSECPLAWIVWRPHSDNSLVALTHWEQRLLAS
jgi:hypothetical protein